MRVLVLGGAGMLGHRLWLAFRDRFETVVTLRQPFARYEPLGIFDRARAVEGIDVTRDDDLGRAFATARPDVVINAVGVIKQLQEAHDPIACITINALLPHRLARLCADRGVRLIHVSTDCVFSGKKGHYTEDDGPDPEDLYGRSKLLGEIADHGALTLRTSMIGREIATRAGLVEWLLGQRGGKVRGYRRAIFSGFTTHALAHVVGDIIERHRTLSGLWHVSAEPTQKYELLRLVDDIYGLGVTIEPDDTFICDRSLDSARFRAKTLFTPPSWNHMIREMHDDVTPYDRWRT